MIAVTVRSLDGGLEVKGRNSSSKHWATATAPSEPPCARPRTTMRLRFLGVKDAPARRSVQWKELNLSAVIALEPISPGSFWRRMTVWAAAAAGSLPQWETSYLLCVGAARPGSKHAYKVCSNTNCPFLWLGGKKTSTSIKAQHSAQSDRVINNLPCGCKSAERVNHNLSLLFCCRAILTFLLFIDRNSENINSSFPFM